MSSVGRPERDEGDLLELMRRMPCFAKLSAIAQSSTLCEPGGLIVVQRLPRRVCLFASRDHYDDVQSRERRGASYPVNTLTVSWYLVRFILYPDIAQK